MPFSIDKQQVAFPMSNTLWKALWGPEMTSRPLLRWAVGWGQHAEKSPWHLFSGGGETDYNQQDHLIFHK